MQKDLFKVVLRKHSHKFFWLIPIISVVAIGFLSQTAFVQKGKATLAIYPNGGTVLRGENFEVKAMVEASENINVIAATMTYPPEKVEVISISRENSILNLWIQEAAVLDNNPGFIQFVGGLPSPGFRGSGEVVVVVFRALEIGWAPIGFSSAEVLANDGRGTNVLEEAPYSLFSIQEIKFPDFNSNGRVDLSDLGILIFQFGKSGNEQYDINGDGSVNLRDIVILISLLGESRP